MWYRSKATNKVIHSSAARLYDNICGIGMFDGCVKSGYLIPIENPSVIDILRDTRSVHLATVRYREIHHCSVKEAKIEVKKLKADIASFNTNKRGQKKQWKKKNTAKAVSTENSQDTVG